MSHHPSAKPVLPAQPAPPPHGTHICANSLQPSPPVLKADTEASPSSPGGLLWLQGTVQYKPGESCPLRWSAAGLPGPRRGRELPNCRDATRSSKSASGGSGPLPQSLSKLPLSSNSGGGTVRMVLMHMRSFQMTNVDAKIVHTG